MDLTFRMNDFPARKIKQNLQRKFSEFFLGHPLFNLMVNIIIVAQKTFQIFVLCIWEIFFAKFQRFSFKNCRDFLWKIYEISFQMLKLLINFWARKIFLFTTAARWAVVVIESKCWLIAWLLCPFFPSAQLELLGISSWRAICSMSSRRS